MLRTLLDKFKYRTDDGYDVERYWRDRLARWRCSFTGVGDITLSNRDNEKMYSKAKETFLFLCRCENVDFRNSRMLDVGCGNGFYADVFRANGGKKYLGIDITDVLFKRLKKDFPEFEFQKLDIATQELEGQFDLIIMLDVTQHITNDKKFSFAMQNIKSHLSRDGIFIVTSWLSNKGYRNFYEVSRSIGAYKKEFPNYMFSKPIPFRDKFIFSIKNIS